MIEESIIDSFKLDSEIRCLRMKFILKKSYFNSEEEKHRWLLKELEGLHNSSVR